MAVQNAVYKQAFILIYGSLVEQQDYPHIRLQWLWEGLSNIIFRALMLDRWRHLDVQLPQIPLLMRRCPLLSLKMTTAGIQDNRTLVNNIRYINFTKMVKKSKGLVTKENIVAKAREVFNSKGTDITLKELSMAMEMPISRITNHYPTKDDLFVAISEEYEERFSQIKSDFTFSGDFSLVVLRDLLLVIMDLQYEYRCLMLFACATGLNQTKMKEQITAKWKHNLSGFMDMIEGLVALHIMTPKALEDEHFQMIKFQYINLLTTWLVSYTLYDFEKALADKKAIYLRTILLGFEPYLTSKGKLQLAGILEPLTL